MTGIDYNKLLAISVLAALAIGFTVPRLVPNGAETVLEKSDRLPIAAGNAEPIAAPAR